MPNFLALTSRGLGDVLSDELTALGATKTKKLPGGVEFSGNWALCYRANLALRSAVRVVLPVLDFPVYQVDDLYHHLLKKHDFTKYIRPDQTLAIEASVRDSRVFRDQRFLAQKAKDAIVDQFRAKFDRRPDVDSEDPDLRVLVRVIGAQASVAIDTSGESLAFRGYRTKSVAAPLREHVAAGLLLATGWRGESPLVDLMCGSGTFVIEAAWLATGRAPGGLRREFGFQRHLNFRAEDWAKAREEELAKVIHTKKVIAFGYDRSREAISAARVNAERAGVKDLVSLSARELSEAKPPTLGLKAGEASPPGILVLNPPYAQRLGGSPEADPEGLYRKIGEVVRERFQGWTLWVLSGNEELTQHLRLKSARKIPVMNGNLDCRFLKYEIR